MNLENYEKVLNQRQQAPKTKGKGWKKGIKMGPLSEEHRRRISEANKGKPKSEESKRKLSKRRMGSGNPMYGRRASEETLKLLREHSGKYWKGKKRLDMMGERNWKWRGGITPEIRKIRNSVEYKEWRRKIFQRDNYTCRFCGARSGNVKKVIIHADHIKPFSLYPELRLEVDNGRTLCKPCHLTTDTHGYNKSYGVRF